MDIKVMLDEGAYMPKYAHDIDAGMDLLTPRVVVIMPHNSSIVDTGIHVEIPVGYVGMIKSKSGLNVKHNVVAEGVIDAGYTGSITVKLYNHGNEPYVIKKGEKLTQLVILPIPKVNIIQVDQLQDTERGNNGFGSTGK